MNIDELYELIDQIPVTEENKDEIEEIKYAIAEGNMQVAVEKLKKFTVKDKKPIEDKKEEIAKFPKKLRNNELEQIYIGLLLQDPKSIVKYYFLKEDCFFEQDAVFNLYRRVLYTDGEAYASEKAKQGFNFGKMEESYQTEQQFRKKVQGKKYDMEKIYVELCKLFVLRKNYIEIPIAGIQEKVVDIIDYDLYDQMSIEEVKAAVEQVNATEKFKRAVLNTNLTQFLEEDNNLTNGLNLPFPILSSVFKGIRKGETMAFAMPSNAGKSRFTINLATYVSLVHKKKVLIISNEMSEEKMKLCFITTIVNNVEIQQLHGQKLHKTEGEILEFKFRPDPGIKANLDEHGFILKEEGETKKDFITRLGKISSEFKQTIMATDWVNKQLENSIYFINITDHTNDELRKVIMNYYYKEKIEYVFYDTLKTDTANIGNGEELKKTTTILSNLAQNFNLFIYSTLQLAETTTLPVNLNINDLAVSRTVKEVLDTLCLVKQIPNTALEQYHYSFHEVDTKFYDLKKEEDPDVRYYACVVDKNRAGAKPKVLFKLNLAYNYWEELGYLKLKEENEK